jgi:hypothetical protein
MSAGAAVQQTFSRAQLRAALQTGAGSVVGGGPEYDKAFKHGWDAQAQRIWDLLELTDPEIKER